MAKFVDRTGETWLSNQGYTMEIIHYENCTDSTVLFKDEKNTTVTNLHYCNIVKGAVNNPNHISVRGIGFLGEGIYKSRDKVLKKYSIEYSHWSHMLDRCYGKTTEAYSKCTVVEGWYNFQNFAKWFNENYDPEIMKGWHLDKDILVKGNKIYGPNTCCLIPNEINVLIVKSSRNGMPPGIRKRGKKYECRVKHEGVQKSKVFTTKIEAFKEYKKQKELIIKKSASRWKGIIEENVYRAIIDYKIEITD